MTSRGAPRSTAPVCTRACRDRAPVPWFPGGSIAGHSGAAVAVVVGVEDRLLRRLSRCRYLLLGVRGKTICASWMLAVRGTRGRKAPPADSRIVPIHAGRDRFGSEVRPCEPHSVIIDVKRRDSASGGPTGSDCVCWELALNWGWGSVSWRATKALLLRPAADAHEPTSSNCCGHSAESRGLFATRAADAH
jgi:hypothetical protein